MSKLKNHFFIILFLSFTIGFSQNKPTVKKDADKKTVTTPKVVTPVKVTEAHDVDSNATGPDVKNSNVEKPKIVSYDETQVSTVVEVSAAPKEGMDAYKKKILEAFNLPEVDEDVTASILMKFEVFKDGSLNNLMILEETPQGFALGKEAIRVIKSSGNWLPASYGGRFTNQLVLFSIKIKIGSNIKSSIIKKNLNNIETKITATDFVFNNIVEIAPEPVEGFDKFYASVRNSVIVPESDTNGTFKTLVTFYVDKDGTLSDFKVVKETPKSIGLGDEVIRILKTTPKWKAGTKKEFYTLPVTTIIENEPQPEPKKD